MKNVTWMKDGKRIQTTESVIRIDAVRREGWLVNYVSSKILETVLYSYSFIAPQTKGCTNVS